ncbi:MAG: delta-60 repeat domain-containing protein [Pyrinomonadaceae bacterium]|nr:delta-60 repeat domain-containing protein [Pyrinomonadaceae bacterium]
MTRSISGIFRQILAVAAISAAAAAQFPGTAEAAPLLNTPGSLDTTFDGDGRRTFEFFPNSSVAMSSALQPDGKIVVVGANDTSIYPVGVARFNPNGSLDPTFGDGGKKVITNPIRTSLFEWKVALQPDGKILIAGSFPTIIGFDFSILRLNSDGSMDTTFDGDGVFNLNFLGEAEVAYDLAVQPDGKIVLVGGIYFDGTRAFGIARVLPNGGIDPTFGTGNGTMITDIRDPASNGFLFAEAFAVGLQSDGKIIVAGRGFTLSLSSYMVLARYTANGVLDLSLIHI